MEVIISNKEDALYMNRGKLVEAGPMQLPTFHHAIDFEVGNLAPIGYYGENFKPVKTVTFSELPKEDV